LSGGGNHGLGVTSDGIAYSWGSHSGGRLGNNSFTSQQSPGIVSGGITNWTQVSAGLDHSLGLTATGIAYAWGVNFSGALGDGTTTERSSPVTVVGGITNWSQLSASAGSRFSLGLTATGIAYAWGINNTGQLGDGTTTTRSSPVTVVGGLTNWAQVAAGGYHSVRITAT
jgi:alpha-tubulin suppressor-like RCC1 family protein